MEIFDYDNILLLPRKCRVDSRSECDASAVLGARSFKLPVGTIVSLGPDAATLTRLSSFDDGPQTGVVHITTVSLFDPAGSSVTQSVTLTFSGALPSIPKQRASTRLTLPSRIG